MPLNRTPLSRSQLCELLGVEPARFVAIERARKAGSTGFVLVTESDMNTSGTFPQLTTGGKRIGTKKGGKKKAS